MPEWNAGMHKCVFGGGGVTMFIPNTNEGALRPFNFTACGIYGFLPFLTHNRSNTSID